MKKILMSALLLVSVMCFLVGCGEKPGGAGSSNTSSVSGITVKVSILNGWDEQIKTLAISPAGEKKYGSDLLGDKSIEAWGLRTVEMTFPESNPKLDLLITDAKGSTFTVTGLDLTSLKDGGEVNVELSLSSDGTGTAVLITGPQDQ